LKKSQSFTSTKTKCQKKQLHESRIWSYIQQHGLFDKANPIQIIEVPWLR